jgi:hypothetical protein
MTVFIMENGEKIIGRKMLRQAVTFRPHMGVTTIFSKASSRKTPKSRKLKLILLTKSLNAFKFKIKVLNVGT